MRFHGKRRELENKMADHGIHGRWEKEPNGVRMMRCADGSNLHWSKTTGKLWCDGKPAQKELLAQLVQTAVGANRRRR